MSTTTETHDYGITRTVSTAYDETIARVRELLKEEGFGVLTEIDVKRTLKEKIDKDVEPYVILGACNPNLAARALEIEPDVGLLLPCNVVVRQHAGHVIVSAMDPQLIAEFSDLPELRAVADEAKVLIDAALDSLIGS